MGTRNMIAVFVDGEYKVAQYCQWDGYPEGQGQNCLRFLRYIMDESKFREKLKMLHYISSEKLNALAEYYGAHDGFIDIKGSERFKNAYPELHRDTGAQVLEMIQNGNVKELQNAITFAADGGYCDWAYVIDLDKRTFEVYEGGREDPLTEKDRFYFLKDEEEDEYSGVHMVCSWSLDNLPYEEEFIKTVHELESE